MYRTEARPSASPAAAPAKHHGEDVRRHAARDIGGLRADGHANADFAAALQHGVIEHTVQADAGQQQRDGGEEERQHGQQALAHGLRADQFRLRADVADAEFRARARHFAAQRGGQRQRVGADWCAR